MNAGGLTISPVLQQQVPLENKKDVPKPLLSTLGQDHAAKAYGIERNAALNRLSYFNVVDGLPPDVMHDLLEGAVNCEVKIMLQTYIYNKGLFTLAQLNNRMKSFK